jgi:hypothetical protein
MTVCILCPPDAAPAIVHWRHREVASNLGGSVGFVGALPDLNVFIVARVPCTDCPHKLYDTHARHFHEVPRGTLVFIASDRRGREIDVDAEALFAILQ